MGALPPPPMTERYLNVELVTGANDGTSEVDAWRSWADAMGGLTFGERLNVKNPSSRYDVSGDGTFIVSGNNDTPIHIRGYGSTIGDGVLAQMENFRISVGGSNILVQDLDILNASSINVPLFDASGFNVTFFNCKGVRTAVNIPTVFRIQNGGNVVNCYADLQAGGNVGINNYGVIMVTNGVAYANIVRIREFVADNNSLTDMAGIRLSAPVEHSAAAVRNLIYTDRGVYAGPVAGILTINISSGECGGYHIVNNTIDNFPVGILMKETGVSTTEGTSTLCNNLITLCPTAVTGYPVAITSGTQLAINNAYDGVMTGVVPIESKRLTQDPYTDPENQDFSLNTTEGGGAVCRANAQDLNGTLDIGAIAA